MKNKLGENKCLSLAEYDLDKIHMIDCDDDNPDVHPRNEERCDNDIDDDCRCDHSLGTNVTGQPILLLTGAVQCVASESFLDCSRTIADQLSKQLGCPGASRAAKSRPLGYPGATRIPLS